MADQTKQPGPGADKTPAKQTGEEHGSIKRPQRGEDDFQGHGDTPRGSETETAAASGRRG